MFETNATKYVCVKNASTDVAVRIACKHVCIRNASTNIFERKASNDTTVRNASIDVSARNTFKMWLLDLRLKMCL
jgi:hypothetical protein